MSNKPPLLPDPRTPLPEQNADLVEKWDSGKVFVLPGIARQKQPDKGLFPETSDSFACPN